MSEYWTPLERLLAQDTAVVNPSVEIPRMLVEQHYVAPDNEQAVRELLAEHSDTYIEDPDSEYDYYCQCGKWLERDQYDLPDHQAAVLDDAGLLLQEYGPQRPPPKAPDSPVPAAFQFPRRYSSIGFTPLDYKPVEFREGSLPDYQRISAQMSQSPPVSQSLDIHGGQPGVGARLTKDSRCTNCNDRIQAGDVIQVECKPDMAGTWRHTDCNDRQLQRAEESL